jgi:nicotinamidase-related amidase
MARLDRAHAALVIIDVQEKLMPVIHDQEGVTRNLERLVRGCHILGVPELLTEQYVKGLGSTVAPLRRAFEESGGYMPLEKLCFSGLRSDQFHDALGRLGRKQIIVAGVETHVCVFQTVRDLLSDGYEAHIVADAVSSRTAQNREIALRRMIDEGAWLTSTELALFDLLVQSGTDEFRAIARLVK